mmetsp:Transcript_26416/g.52645  ORF Transcript_26416/g.52645 Transcript_26416/m.52645 type:complete len:90 (+) Transcript_26416:93-362(+)
MSGFHVDDVAVIKEEQKAEGDEAIDHATKKIQESGGDAAKVMYASGLEANECWYYFSRKMRMSWRGGSLCVLLVLAMEGLIVAAHVWQC